jgi:hypothetical protein
MNLIPVSYRLSWSRYENASESNRAEITATSFSGDKPVKWVVREGACVLAKTNRWVIEPIPSSRTERFLNQTRFDSPEEAYEAALRYFIR